MWKRSFGWLVPPTSSDFKGESDLSDEGGFVFSYRVSDDVAAARPLEDLEARVKGRRGCRVETPPADWQVLVRCDGEPFLHEVRGFLRRSDGRVYVLYLREALEASRYREIVNGIEASARAE
jgi:hypothetical protein